MFTYGSLIMISINTRMVIICAAEKGDIENKNRLLPYCKNVLSRPTVNDTNGFSRRAHTKQ